MGSFSASGINSSGSLTVRRVKITASAANSALGIFSSAGTIDHADIQATASTGSAAGISTGGTNVTITNSSINVNGVDAEGISSTTVNLAIANVAIAAVSTGSNVDYARAFDTYSTTTTPHTVTIRSARLSATTTGSTGTYAIWSGLSTTPGPLTTRVDGSVLIAPGFVVDNGAPAIVRITNSRLHGGPALGASCAFVYDENFAPFQSTCP
jgi:hypothetical protein